MRRLVFVLLVSCLLVTLVFVWKESISPVKASPDIYQGDLVLTGNNVTTIEGRFDINGSIIVEENATLILRNAVVNFTQTEGYQFNMIFTNGHPRLTVENTTITGNNHVLLVKFYGNSSASTKDLTAFAAVLAEHHSVVNLSDSLVSLGAWTYDDSSLIAFNCMFGYLWTEASIDLSNSTIEDSIGTVTDSVNCTVNEHKPGFVRYWNFQQNCSVVVPQGGSAPNITLRDTEVGGWSFYFDEFTNATIFNSQLYILWSRGFSTISLHNSMISFDSSCYESSKLWFMNSTSNTYKVNQQSVIYVNWYLDAHVVDSIGQDVPSATVTVIYPNTTIVESRLTSENGSVGFTLMEKMMNAAGEYPVGTYTVEATYDIYSDTTIVNMTENQQITLTLEDFVIPEFPSFLILPLFMIATLLTVIVHKRKHSM